MLGSLIYNSMLSQIAQFIPKRSVSWVDQGFGNRKGEIFIQLMRPVSGREDVMIAEKRWLFEIAEHKETHPKSEVTDDFI